MPDNTTVSLQSLIEKRLKQFNIEPAVIFEALNLAVQSPAEVIQRFLQAVARDSVRATRPMFRWWLRAYRRNPTQEVRQRICLMLLADAFLQTKATLDDCVSALRDLGQLPNGCEQAVV